MGNHNILVTNPKGTRTYVFADNLTRRECQDHLDEIAPAPIGWYYQIVNLNKKPQRRPLYTLIQGFTRDGELVGQRKAHIHYADRWEAPKRVKRELRALGAVSFSREKVWEELVD